ncbi:MAG: type II and III secretion system protein family protein [Acidobacteriaceae bacterium]
MIRRQATIRRLSPALLAAAFSTAACSCALAQNKAVSAATPSPFVGDMGTNAQLVGQPLHLLVGRSMFVNTENRLRRIYVSNPDVLDSFTSSPHQIVITAKTPGLSSLVLWDESGQSQAYLINSDIDVSDLNHALQDAFPTESIRVQGRGDQVGLAGTVSSHETAEAAVKLAGLFSKDVANSLQVSTRHTPQVRLKVRIIEIDRSRAAQLGFNFFGPGMNTFNSTTGQFGAITVGASPPTSQSVPTAGTSLLSLSSLLGLFYYNTDLQLGAAIQALTTNQIAQILAEPTITAISGEKASFLSGGEFPYPVVQGGTGGFTSVTIQFRPYGVKLDFTPTVLADGTIQLKVAPEVSALDYSNEVTISGYTIPAISTRRAETLVELKSGQSFAISGLLDNRTSDQLSKIPGIGDIPILGKLFQSKNVTKSVAELAVIVTPTLVDPLSDNPTPTQPKTAMPFIDSQKFDKGFAPKIPPPQPQPQPVPQQVPIQ